ncbi:MAG: flagellar hook protein FlgE [Sulfuricella sp.]|nr:flagellar hook protein FlgE [Sulfuricella sp.]
MSFQQGLSGLNSASKSLDVIGNNISNAGTIGFKGAQAQFADVYAASLSGGGTAQIGIGQKLAAAAQQFSQGNISPTNNPLDMAINGAGFFRMSQGGAITFSRNGQFQLDKNGYLVNNSGLHLTGYDADASGKIIPTNPVELQFTASKQSLPPVATTKLATGLNLDARAKEPVSSPFDINNPLTFNNSTSATVYDTLGNSHVFSTYFVKTAIAGEWDVHATLDGVLEEPAGTPVVTLGTTTLTFNSAGALTTAMPISVSLDLNAVATALGTTNAATSPLAFNLDYTGSSQYGANFGVNTLTQDGFAAGNLAGFNVSSDGTIQGRYTNGQSKNLGQVVMADFANSQGLQALGNNQWAQSPESGQPLMGTGGTGKFGVLQSAAVEESNVDLTGELVNMITAQRIYQANAQTIKTQDQVLQTLVNLR